MKIAMLVAMILGSTAALAHPNGVYEIDNDSDLTVTFNIVKRCPTDVEGALKGGLRTLTFTEAAESDPYLFVSGYYVEIHDASGEVYVQTDDQCVPVEDGEEIEASRSSFAGYPLRRLR